MELRGGLDDWVFTMGGVGMGGGSKAWCNIVCLSLRILHDLRIPQEIVRAGV